ncbi:MAG: GHMP kinase [Alphaproteobacteria bacterium]|nr:GHMP kinase [Alphaproteobacteria bacterium]
MLTQSLDPTSDRLAAVEVLAPARLHLGFLDLDGSIGRRFGSIGLTIDGIATRLKVARGPAGSGRDEAPDRARRVLASLADRLDIGGALHVTLDEAIPEHVGLGSGTQLGLAVAAALARLTDRPVDGRTLAPLVERGARSGIGIGAFEQGGFLVDGGKGADDAPAPIVARAEFPASWRLVLIFDESRRGLSGSAERAAFRALPPFARETAARLCHLTLLRLLPGLAEGDFAAVTDSIGEINARLGDHFAAVQGGRYASIRVAATVEWLREQGYDGIGQSSWGPTGFVIIRDEMEAQALRQQLEARFGGRDGLSFSLCAGRNRGAEIRTVMAR